MTDGKLITREEGRFLVSLLLFMPSCAAVTVALVALIGLLVD
ncbi:MULTISPECIES: hypothetical protein [Microvirga]|nr:MULTISPECIES: hypothetical protein [unclassified Microvirga]